MFLAPFNHFRVWLPRELLSACYEEIHGTAAPATLALFGYEFVRDPVILDLVRALATADEQPGPMGPVFVDGLALALASHLVTTWFPPSRPARRAASRGNPELAGVFDYIDAQLDRRLRLDDLCKLSGMGRLRFTQLFRKATGLSPHQYVLRQRVSTAQSLLLHPSRTVVDVALSAGFSSQAHFSSTFKRPRSGERPSASMRLAVRTRRSPPATRWGRRHAPPERRRPDVLERALG
jgi:AraC-like DNA-binding protein